MTPARSQFPRLLVLLSGAAPILAAFPALLPAQSPVISEFVAANDGSLLDEDAEASDWIEVHNPAAIAASLGGWYLTDNELELDKWRFPAVQVPAEGYLIVFASNKDRAVAGRELHTNFKLEAAGGYLALVRPEPPCEPRLHPPRRQRAELHLEPPGDGPPYLPAGDRRVPLHPRADRADRHGGRPVIDPGHAAMGWGRGDQAPGLALLQFLFGGAVRPLPCGSSLTDPGNRTLLNGNGDPGVDISDAVRLLSFLFSGGQPHVLGTSCVRIAGCPSRCRS